LRKLRQRRHLKRSARGTRSCTLEVLYTRSRELDRYGYMIQCGYEAMIIDLAVTQ
jgi:hypothetical protein